MAEIKKIKLGNTTYDIVDAGASRAKPITIHGLWTDPVTSENFPAEGFITLAGEPIANFEAFKTYVIYGTSLTFSECVPLNFISTDFKLPVRLKDYLIFKDRRTPGSYVVCSGRDIRHMAPGTPFYVLEQSGLGVSRVVGGSTTTDLSGDNFLYKLEHTGIEQIEDEIEEVLNDYSKTKETVTAFNTSWASSTDTPLATKLSFIQNITSTMTTSNYQESWRSGLISALQYSTSTTNNTTAGYVNILKNTLSWGYVTSGTLSGTLPATLAAFLSNATHLSTFAPAYAAAISYYPSNFVEGFKNVIQNAGTTSTIAAAIAGNMSGSTNAAIYAPYIAATMSTYPSNYTLQFATVLSSGASVIAPVIAGPIMSSYSSFFAGPISATINQFPGDFTTGFATVIGGASNIPQAFHNVIKENSEMFSSIINPEIVDLTEI